MQPMSDRDAATFVYSLKITLIIVAVSPPEKLFLFLEIFFHSFVIGLEIRLANLWAKNSET